MTQIAGTVWKNHPKFHVLEVAGSKRYHKGIHVGDIYVVHRSEIPISADIYHIAIVISDNEKANCRIPSFTSGIVFEPLWAAAPTELSTVNRTKPTWDPDCGLVVEPLLKRFFAWIFDAEFVEASSYVLAKFVQESWD